MLVAQIAENYQIVQERIARSAENAGTSPQNITLVAVTKTHPVELILAAYQAGLRHFGENHAQELATKRQAVEKELGKENGITWHAIGTLQSRKTDYVADYADCFHALDRLKVAQHLSKRLVENGRSLPAFLELNLSGEASKAGFDCQHWETNPQQRQNLLAKIEQITQLPNLHLTGLMTIAPWHIPATDIQTIFHRTHALRDWLRQNFPTIAWTHLSMGMTDDFELAIVAGATHIRVGRALFGERAIPPL